MEKLKFNISINAPREKVWDKMWSDEGYRYWTSAFTQDSHVETDWNEGSKVLFLDGKGSGMAATLEKKVPNETMIFRYEGEVKDGKEIPKEWAGAHECYYLSGDDGKTELRAEMDGAGEFAEYLGKTFPKALQLLKENCERQ